LPEQEQPKTVTFDGVEEVPLLYANAFLLQGSDDPSVFILNVGQYATPIIAGTDEERARIFAMMPSLTARMLARLVLTPDKLRALADILRQVVERLDANQQSLEKGEKTDA